VVLFAEAYNAGMASERHPRKRRIATADREVEFTPQRLRAALLKAGRAATQAAFRRGLPITFLRRKRGGFQLVQRYADGREVVVSRKPAAARG
jgi:hypothetical protein